MRPEDDGEVLRIGDLEVWPDDGLLRAGDRTVQVTERELGLLAALAREPGRVVRREELYAAVWGRERRSNDRSVDVYVHRLRAKLADALPGWSCIHTHFRSGYRLGLERSRPFHKAATGS